ncbi:BON domain-containing protein [Streptomyces prunicolor]|uniref:BON domain-containing protein n=1 Tax=Streptomyces prunicolor TaxID=67348 RepID=UPI0034169B17
MTHTVVAVGSEAPFKQIVEPLGQWKVSAVPVLAGEGRVVGVVSEADLLAKEEFRGRGDLLKVFLRPDEEIAGEIRHSVLGRLPSTDSLTVEVTDGVVTLGGSLPDRTLVPVAARALRAVEGVVDVRLDLTHR